MVPALRRGGEETSPAARATAGQRSRMAGCEATSESVAIAPSSSAPLAAMPYPSAIRRRPTSTLGVNCRRFMFG